jgi:hypothetical protein
MSDLVVIGRAEIVSFPELKLTAVPARVDTGAKTSAIWASGIIEKQGVLQCVLFGPDSPLYNGEVLRFSEYELRTIASSIGEPEERYVVKLLVEVAGRKIRSSFTLANRSHQAYPMLIGRNLLRGKFVVDVKQGTPNLAGELARSQQLQIAKRKKGSA